MYRACFTLMVCALVACAPSKPGNNGGDGDGGPDPVCEPACPADQVCVADVGCRACQPDRKYCSGTDDNQVWQCNADGTDGTLVEDCGDSICNNGFCLTPCERADMVPSNVGCHFWAVDLDNEAADILGIATNDAAKQQFAIAVANVHDWPAKVTVYKNTARVGQPIVEEVVVQVTVAANGLEQINLPQREVDGTMQQNSAYTKGSGSGTFVSSHGYRVESDTPIVAYQFNPIVQQFSNDASILIPRQALGKDYYVLGWPTANPCGQAPGGPISIDSIPDHTAVTIVGVHDGTQITVIPTHPIMASGGDSGIAVPETPAGTPLVLTINQYDVVNLESLQPIGSITDCITMQSQDGDFTGTRVTSNKSIVVFSSNERAAGLGGATPPDPPNWDGESCCTDHLEQQMFPTTALGFKFAVSRSPVRSTDANYKEPDIYRVLATKNNTTITTSLPSPNDSFTLQAGEWRPFHSDAGFTVVASEAIMVGQYLVSQGYIPQGGIGDPTFIIFPAADQHRKDYTFLVPTTFTKNYMVLAMPDGAVVRIDGQPLGEFQTNCVTAAIGTLDGVGYSQMTCLMTEGVHKVSSDQPLGLTVYGYYNVGSYGYPGGSDVKIINPIN